MVKASAYLFKHFRKELALQQDFKEWHAAVIMITSMRSFKHGTIFGVGDTCTCISRYSMVVTNSSGLYNQRSGLEEAQLIKMSLKQHSKPLIQSKQSNLN